MPVEPRTSSIEKDQLLAKLAIKHQLVEAGQIREAVEFQRRERTKGRNLPLGEALVEKGFITSKQLDTLRLAKELILRRGPDRVFCKIAVESGFVTPDKIDEALSRQARIFKGTREFKPASEMLVACGFLTPGQRDAVNSRMTLKKTDEPTPSSSQAPGQEPEAGPASDSPPVTGVESIPYSRGLLPGNAIAEDVFFDIIVTNDKLKVFLLIKGDVPERLNAGNIRTLLETKGVVNGIISDEMIEQCLKKGSRDRLWKIAQGTPPKAGKPAEIRYFFASRAQETACGDDRTKIDLRDRGQVPQVKKGCLLAEKAPRIKEENGIDVYGKPIQVEKSKDVPLLRGTGVEVSGDGLKLYATVDGRPELSILGKLFVYPELNINGDVDFETGNISFDGAIIVKGIVQDGFRVTGGSLTAREISKATIDVAGNIEVYGGILGAAIKAGGSVKAVHMHSSKVESIGDVIVDKGIYDSGIVTSGKCMAERGTIVSSKIVAKQGVDAAHIGSERSVPCTLIVGIDPNTQKELDRLREAIALKNKAREQVRENVERLQKQSSREEVRIGELAQIQERSMREERMLRQRKNELKPGDAGKAAAVDEEIAQAVARAKSAGEELERLLDRQETILQDIDSQQDRIKEIDKEILDLDDEASVIAQWISDNPGTPVVKALDTVYAGTVIKGIGSSWVFRSNTKRVMVKEGRAEDLENGTPGERKMFVHNLP
ncbi:MAG: FapA family protein [Syntrophobacteraceae bacterium]|nr:FapA family protein [Desulfobacteraceae bacterium]